VGGVAVIKVGAATETEMKEKKARVEDAMHATKAAVEGGHRARRRCGAPALAQGARRPQGRRRSAGRHQYRETRRRGTAALDRQNAGQEGSIVVQKVKEGEETFASTR